MLPTQLGRTEAAAALPIPRSMPLLNLLTGEVDNAAVYETFRTSGLTKREMTALLGCLLSINSIEKATPEGDWKANSKPKFREAGKMGRMSEFKALMSISGVGSCGGVGEGGGVVFSRDNLVFLSLLKSEMI